MKTDKNVLPTDEEVASGVYFCFRNADSLRAEAQILYESNHKARAIALLVLCIEELGKIPFLFSALTLRRKENANAKQFWRTLSNHKPKQQIWAYYGDMLETANSRDAPSFARRLPENIGSALDNAKQRCLYTDLADGSFQEPEAFASANPDIWPWLASIVDPRLESFRALHGELWLSQRMVSDCVRLADPLARTPEDEAWIAKQEALGNLHYKSLP